MKLLENKLVFKGQHKKHNVKITLPFKALVWKLPKIAIKAKILGQFKH